jgi:hypothetical protein
LLTVVIGSNGPVTRLIPVGGPSRNGLFLDAAPHSAVPFAKRA